MRRFLTYTCLALLSGALWSRADAQSRTIEIVSADRLELRRVDNQELIVISGDVLLNVDRDVVRAERVEYNKTLRTLTLVGQGYYKTFTKNSNGIDTEQVLTGDSLVVNLATENLAGEDVIITTDDLQIRGEEVERVPGQLQAQNSYFTPCARCGRTPNDYAFRADRVYLYPGDRLVAYGATLLLADTPIVHLPFVVLFLNDPARQPYISVGSTDPDGFFIRAGLPFVIGSNATGFTLLRYYQNRTPSFGAGVLLTAYDLPFGVRRLDLAALAEPKPVFRGSGYDFDYSVTAVGQLPWEGTRNGVEYTFKLDRRDVDQTPLRQGVTNLNFTARAEWDEVSAVLNYVDRFGTPPEGPLPQVLKRPELALDFKEFRVQNLVADFAVVVGAYTAPSNPLSRSARAQGDNITAERLLENHVITYETPLWSGATLSAVNRFTGQYYSTGARVVNLDFGVRYLQRITASTLFEVNYNYARQEGVSPFVFDAVAGRRLSGTLRASVTSRLTPWLTIEAEQGHDFVRPAEKQTPARLAVAVTPDPVDFRASLRYNFAKNQLDDWQATLNFGRGTGFTASIGTTFRHEAGYQPLLATAAYTNPDRSATFKLTASYNLQAGYLDYLRSELNGVSDRDAILNPVVLAAQETYYTHNPRIEGSVAVGWRGVTFRSNHNFLLPDDIREAEDASEGRGTLTFGVNSPSGALNNWQVQYGGAYDLTRGGWISPILTAKYSTTFNLQRIAVDTTFSMPGLDRNFSELASANLNVQWDVTPRIGLAGEVRYARSRSGPIVRDALSLRPFGVTFALGGAQPDAYFTVLLDQTFVFGPNVDTEPIKPIFRLLVDRCCWAFMFEANPVAERVRFSITLPVGGQTLDVTRNNGVQIPGLTSGGTP